MAGLTTALLVGGATLGGAALSSSASRSAARTVQQGTDAATAEQRRQFDRLLELQMPGYRRGEQAAGLYMTALGIPGMTGQPAGTSPAQTGGVTRTYPGLMTQGGAMGEMTGPQINPGVGGGTPQPQINGGPSGGIYDQIKNTPGYQAQLDQGVKAIDRAAPLVGGMYSGRRMKALNDYGQNTFGAYYNDWLNRVGGVAGQSPQIASNIGAQGMQSANNIGQLMMTGANARAQGSLNSANAWTSALGTGVGLYGGSQGWF